MKRVLILILAALMLMTGCSLRLKPSDAFDEKELYVAAETVMSVMDAGDIDAIRALVRSDVRKDAFTDDETDVWHKRYAVLGDFCENTSKSVLGKTFGDAEEDCAVVMLVRAYEHDTAVFTLTFDTDCELLDIGML